MPTATRFHKRAETYHSNHWSVGTAFRYILFLIFITLCSASVSSVSGAALAGVTVTPAGNLITNESGTTATFTVKLNTQPADDVVVDISSSNPAEASAAPTQMQFTTSNWDQPQTVIVTGVDDLIDDNDRTFLINLVLTSIDVNYNGRSVRVSGTNRDDEVAGVTVDPSGNLITNESGTTATFTVVLNTQPTADVFVDVSSSNSSEASASPTQISFTASNWNQPQTITVTGVDDLIDDNDRTFLINLALASGDTNYNGQIVSVSGTNRDDEVAGVTVDPTGNLITNENGTTAAFTVRLNTQPADSVFVDISSSKPNEATASPSQIVFSTSNWFQPQTITVFPVDDPVFDLDQQFSIVLDFSSTDPLYNSRRIMVAGTNRNNDPAFAVPPTVPLCERNNFIGDAVVRSSIPASIDYAIHCRVLYQNGQITTWFGEPLYTDGAIGLPGLVGLGILQAIDIFSPTGVHYFEGGAVFCLQGTGTLIWLAASGMPRRAKIIGSYAVEEFAGFTCATLFEPGTLVLVRENPVA